MDGCQRRGEGRRVARVPGRRSSVAAALALTFTLTLVAATFGPSNARASGLKAMWGPATHDGVSLFPTYRTLGVKLYEDALRWNEIAKRRPRDAQNPRARAYKWP